SLGPFPHVEETLEVDDALAHALELLDGYVPARDGRHHARVGLLDVEAEAALRGEAAEDEGIVHRGEVLAPDGELRLAVRAPAIEALGVLRRGASVVVAAAARRGRVADGHALERAGRVRRQLEALDSVDSLRRLGMDVPAEPPAAFGEAVAEAPSRGRHLDETQHAAPIAPSEGHADLLPREPAALERLGHERQGHAHGDRVHAEEIAEVVGARQG